jgi:hypothetical protein
MIVIFQFKILRKSSFNATKGKISKRISFTYEENIFLIQSVMQFKFINDEKEKWKTISLLFNSTFYKNQRKLKPF